MKKILLTGLICATAALHADLAVKNGEKVAFLGDSITLFGNRPDGYVRLVESGLKKAGCKIVVIPAGVSGSQSRNMLKRTPGVLAKKPDWLLISCGVNDVGNPKSKVNLEEYKKNISAILDMAESAGVKVMLLTPTLYGEDIQGKYNQKLIGYADFLRKQVCPNHYRSFFRMFGNRFFHAHSSYCLKEGVCHP